MADLFRTLGPVTILAELESALTMVDFKNQRAWGDTIEGRGNQVMFCGVG